MNCSIILHALNRSIVIYSLLSKIDWAKVKKAKCIHRFCKDQDGKLRLVNKPPFEIPLSILDVWYTQALMW